VPVVEMAVSVLPAKIVTFWFMVYDSIVRVQGSEFRRTERRRRRESSPPHAWRVCVCDRETETDREKHRDRKSVRKKEIATERERERKDSGFRVQEEKMS